MRMLRARLWGALGGIPLLAAFCGCATLGQYRTVAAPAVVEALFDLCHPGDGALSLEVFDGDAFAALFEVDWIAPQAAQWRIGLGAMPAGTFATLRADAQGLNWEGSLLGAPTVLSDRNGFLNVDGRFVGLKVAEVPCLLKGRLPRSWRPPAERWIRRGDALQFERDEGRRTIVVTVKNLAGQQPTVACAKIHWDVLWKFWGQTVQWCFEDGGALVSTLEGMGDWHVRWVPMQEQP